MSESLTPVDGLDRDGRSQLGIVICHARDYGRLGPLRWAFLSLGSHNTISNVQRDPRRISHQSAMCIQRDNELIKLLARFEMKN
jgi:hypothetical protein